MTSPESVTRRLTSFWPSTAPLNLPKECAASTLLAPTRMSHAGQSDSQAYINLEESRSDHGRRKAHLLTDNANPRSAAAAQPAQSSQRTAEVPVTRQVRAAYSAMTTCARCAPVLVGFAVDGMTARQVGAEGFLEQLHPEPDCIPRGQSSVLCKNEGKPSTWVR